MKTFPWNTVSTTTLLSVHEKNLRCSSRCFIRNLICYGRANIPSSGHCLARFWTCHGLASGTGHVIAIIIKSRCQRPIRKKTPRFRQCAVEHISTLNETIRPTWPHCIRYDDSLHYVFCQTLNSTFCLGIG